MNIKPTLLKTTLSLVLLMLVSILSLFGQKLSVDLAFTAVDNAAHVKLESITVMNRTQGGSTVVNWPDTTVTVQIAPGDRLLLVGTALGESVGVRPAGDQAGQFRLSACVPNPVGDEGLLSVTLPSAGAVNFTVTDIRGRTILNLERGLQAGTHAFVFHPGGERVCFLTARWNNLSRSVKILAEGTGSGHNCRIEFAGAGIGNPALKQTLAATDLVLLESGILDAPAANKTYTFQFATNIPCPGTPTVTYEGQVYNTIQIFSQCWFKENLNTGAMIPGVQLQTDNGVLEKYCLHDQQSYCDTYGGLYQWKEMMQYTNLEGVQGICPPGWHLPTDEEIKVLEGAVDSQYGIGDPVWDLTDWNGYDVAMNVKTTSGWNFNSNGTDAFGFSAKPAGDRDTGSGLFTNNGYYLFLWSSTERNPNWAWHYTVSTSYAGIDRLDASENYGYSVRCLRND